MEIFNILKSNINPDMSLLSIVDVFSRMCRMKIGFEDELFLFETNIVARESKHVFQFSLVRQFSDSKDEPTQIHIDITYNLPEVCKKLLICSWHENYGEFIQSVLLSNAFEICKNKKIEKIDVWMDVT